MSYSVVWILFLGGCLFLMYFYSGKMRQVKKYQKQQRAAYEENRVKYSHFTSEVFDQTPDEELTHAVLFMTQKKRVSTPSLRWPNTKNPEPVRP